MTVSKWTNGDLASLTCEAAMLAQSDTHCYCEYCGVVEVQCEEKYCDVCLSEILDDLAHRYGEQGAVEQGLY